MRPRARTTRTLGSASSSVVRYRLQVRISSGKGLFAGGRHLTAFVMRVSRSTSPSLTATDVAALARPSSKRVSYSRIPAKSPVNGRPVRFAPVSYTHLRAHETGRNLVCRLLLEKKKK